MQEPLKVNIAFVADVPFFGTAQMAANMRLSVDAKLATLQKRIAKMGWSDAEVTLLRIDPDSNGYVHEICACVRHDGTRTYVHVSNGFLGSLKVEFKPTEHH